MLVRRTNISASTIRTPGERGDRRGVAGRERLAVEQAGGVLPDGPVAAEQQLQPGGGQRGDAIIDEHGRTPRARWCLRDTAGPRAAASDRHAEAPKPVLDQPQDVDEPAVVVGPVLAGRPRSSRSPSGARSWVDQERQHGEQRQRRGRPRRGCTSARAVEHARQYAGVTPRHPHPDGTGRNSGAARRATRIAFRHDRPAAAP